MKKIIFIMGVSGSGKSTVGKLLAEDLKVQFNVRGLSVDIEAKSDC